MIEGPKAGTRPLTVDLSKSRRAGSGERCARFVWRSKSKYHHQRDSQRSLSFASQPSFSEVMLKVFDAPQCHHAFALGCTLAEGIAGLVLNIRVECGRTTGPFERGHGIAGLVLRDA